VTDLYIDSQAMGVLMPAVFDLLYREYCRARLAEMRKQLLISAKHADVLEADYDLADHASVDRAGIQREAGAGAPN
jgi:hypothetical protein